MPTRAIWGRGIGTGGSILPEPVSVGEAETDVRDGTSPTAFAVALSSGVGTDWRVTGTSVVADGMPVAEDTGVVLGVEAATGDAAPEDMPASS